MMSGVQARSFGAPDETRTPDKTRVDLVRMGPTSAARLEFDAGWRWSDHIKPVAGTESCQVRHVGLLVSGSLHVVHDDGTEVDIEGGQVYVIEPGHDAWVNGDEPALAYEFESKAAEDFARGAAE